MEIHEEVVIVGAGIAGLATALAFHRMGIRSLVLERSHELRSTGAALTLFPNAWRALDALGVANKLTTIYPSFDKGSITFISTGVTKQVSIASHDSKGLGVRAVHRSVLLEALAEELPPGTIRFASKLHTIKTHEQEDWPITVHLEDGTIIKAKVLIGCDGVHSVVAQWLGFNEPVHSGRSAVRGLGSLPQGHGLNHQVKQFLGDGVRLGFIPVNDQQVYWFITSKSRPQDSEMERDPKLIKKDVLERMAKDLLPEKYLEVVRNSDLGTLSSASLMYRKPWDLFLGPALSKGTVTVAGDAMHPMTPDLGQGGCAALEDAVVLARNLGEAVLKRKGKIELTATAVEGGLHNYVRERRWRAASLIVGSFVAGWVQSQSGWFAKFIRDMILYRFAATRMAAAGSFDCGKLPVFPHGGISTSWVGSGPIEPGYK